MPRTSLSDREDEKTKLEDRLRKELPPNVQFEWNATGALVISQGDKLRILNYENPPYPKSDEDVKKVITNLKSVFK